MVRYSFKVRGGPLQDQRFDLDLQDFEEVTLDDAKGVAHIYRAYLSPEGGHYLQYVGVAPTG